MYTCRYNASLTATSSVRLFLSPSYHSTYELLKFCVCLYKKAKSTILYRATIDSVWEFSYWSPWSFHFVVPNSLVFESPFITTPYLSRSRDLVASAAERPYQVMHIPTRVFQFSSSMNMYLTHTWRALSICTLVIDTCHIRGRNSRPTMEGQKGRKRA